MQDLASDVAAAGRGQELNSGRDVVRGAGPAVSRLADQRGPALVGQTANGRAGTPDDIAAAVEFLASPGGSHITSQVLHINGGALSGR